MTTLSSRRQFLGTAGMAVAAASRLNADPLGMPIGLQLFTVQQDLRTDFEGTLRRIAEIGYREVEGGARGKTPEEYRQALNAAGLHCPSGGVSSQLLLTDHDKAIEAAHLIGLKYVTASAQVEDRSRLKAPGDIARIMTLDDYKYTAEQLNKIGEAAKKADLQLVYHNQHQEFRRYDDVPAYDHLLSWTDHDTVKMELDCGWVTLAGYDPVEYLAKYPTRIALLHVKDEQPGFQPSTGLTKAALTTEVGNGVIDWKKVFTAAKKAGIQGYYIEQEPPFTAHPPLEAIKISYDYLHNLKM